MLQYLNKKNVDDKTKEKNSSQSEISECCQYRRKHKTVASVKLGQTDHKQPE
jgi:hypothetical protein